MGLLICLWTVSLDLSHRLPAHAPVGSKNCSAMLLTGTSSSGREGHAGQGTKTVTVVTDGTDGETASERDMPVKDRTKTVTVVIDGTDGVTANLSDEA